VCDDDRLSDEVLTICNEKGCTEDYHSNEAVARHVTRRVARCGTTCADESHLGQRVIPIFINAIAILLQDYGEYVIRDMCTGGDMYRFASLSSFFDFTY
jgi:hypothetical protein